MMRIFDKDWGSMYCEASFNKIDFLPRITATGIDHAFIFNVGFLMLSINLTIWDELMREFNRRNSRND